MDRKCWLVRLGSPWLGKAKNCIWGGQERAGRSWTRREGVRTGHGLRKGWLVLCLARMVELREKLWRGGMEGDVLAHGRLKRTGERRGDRWLLGLGLVRALQMGKKSPGEGTRKFLLACAGSAGDNQNENKEKGIPKGVSKFPDWKCVARKSGDVVNRRTGGGSRDSPLNDLPAIEGQGGSQHTWRRKQTTTIKQN